MEACEGRPIHACSKTVSPVSDSLDFTLQDSKSTVPEQEPKCVEPVLLLKLEPQPKYSKSQKLATQVSHTFDEIAEVEAKDTNSQGLAPFEPEATPGDFKSQELAVESSCEETASHADFNSKGLAFSTLQALPEVPTFPFFNGVCQLPHQAISTMEEEPSSSVISYNAAISATESVISYNSAISASEEGLFGQSYYPKVWQACHYTDDATCTDHVATDADATFPNHAAQLGSKHVWFATDVVSSATVRPSLMSHSSALDMSSATMLPSHAVRVALDGDEISSSDAMPCDEGSLNKGSLAPLGAEISSSAAICEHAAMQASKSKCIAKGSMYNAAVLVTQRAQSRYASRRKHVQFIDMQSSEFQELLMILISGLAASNVEYDVDALHAKISHPDNEFNEVLKLVAMASCLMPERFIAQLLDTKYSAKILTARHFLQDTFAEYESQNFLTPTTSPGIAYQDLPEEEWENSSYSSDTPYTNCFD